MYANVPEVSDELVGEAEECMRGAGPWPWHGDPERRSPEVPTVMEPLREEHTTLLVSIERLRTTADAVGDAALDELQRLVDDNLDFLVHRLIPHAAAEDSALYPTVQRLMGAPGATATISRDHARFTVSPTN